MLPQRMQEVSTWAKNNVNRAVRFIKMASISLTGEEEDEANNRGGCQQAEQFVFLKQKGALG
jgi:hypothetical protein